MVTVKKIAELADVSIGTVDRVLHNRGRVSKETKEKIEKIIAELGYKPNFFAKSLRRSKVYSFAVLLPQAEQDNNFWRLFLPGIQRAINQLEAYNVKISTFYYDRTSGESFKRESWKMLQTEPDGFVLAPVLMPAVEAFVHQIPENLPYIFIDSPIKETNCLLHIGHNSYQSGRLAGQLTNILTGDANGKVAIFRTFGRMIHMADRVNGFIDYLSGNKNLSVIQYDIKGVETNEFYAKLTKQAIGENSDLKGIYITNAYAHGVAKYLKEKKLKDKISLVGYDLVDENVKCLKEGYIDFLISLRPDLQAHRALFALYRSLVQNRVMDENEVTIPIDILTKENIDYHRF